VGSAGVRVAAVRPGLGFINFSRVKFAFSRYGSRWVKFANLKFDYKKSRRSILR